MLISWTYPLIWITFYYSKIKNYQKRYENVKSDLFKLIIQSSIKNINSKKSAIIRSQFKVGVSSLRDQFFQVGITKAVIAP
mgnify:CR=1 FL=1